MRSHSLRPFTLLPLALFCAHAFAHTQDNTDTATELNDIFVSGDKTNRPFLTPSATSHIAPSKEGRDLNDVLRTGAGLYTGHDIGQGGVSVNLRGLEGMGRVNTMIDGINQTTYQANPTHGWSGNVAIINDDFIAGTEVERGLSHGASGSNALGGSVNFRTISSGDLVQEGQEWGSRLTLRNGNNGYGINGMIGLAHRRQWDNGGHFGALFAFGGKTRGAYQNGAGELIAGDELADGAAQEAAAHIRNFMTKLEYAPNRYHSLKLSYIGNRSHTYNNHTPMNLRTDSGQLQYRYNPLSDWVDVNAGLAYTHSQQQMAKDDHDNGFQGRTLHNPTWQLNLSNRSQFEWGNADFNMHYGLQLQRTRYHVDQSQIHNPVFSLVLSRGKSHINTLFWENELNWGRWTLTGGARYEQYRYGGHLPEMDPAYPYIFPRGGNIRFTRRANHFNPYIGLAFKAADWLQLYTTYAHTSRAPLVQEFMSGSSNGSSTVYGVNPYLKSETSRNLDLGLNIFKHGWLTPTDTLRFKANYFTNRVRNYIYEERFYICDDMTRCDIDTYLNTNSSTVAPLTLYINTPDTTRIRGWEIEGGYDFGRGFINLSYSNIKTSLPINFNTEFVGNTQDQPETRLIVDIGTRWLDNKLTIGARMTRTTGDSTVGETNDDVPSRERLPNNPAIFDVYAKYNLTRNAKLFFNIENLTNAVYNYPLSRGTLGTGNIGGAAGWANQGTGRGRTFSAGFTLNF